MIRPDAIALPTPLLVARILTVTYRYFPAIVSSSTAMDGASTTMGASASAIGGETSHSSSNSGVDDSAHQGSMADSMAESMASASGTFMSGAGGGLTALTGLSGESAGSGVSGGAVALRAAPDELRHKTDVLQAPMLSTTLLTRQLKRGISRMIYQPAAVLHVRARGWVGPGPAAPVGGVVVDGYAKGVFLLVPPRVHAKLTQCVVLWQVRGVFSCDEKRANFYFQLANPTHLQPVNHVEIPYLLRSRVSVKEDHKVTRWNPTKVRAVPQECIHSNCVVGMHLIKLCRYLVPHPARSSSFVHFLTLQVLRHPPFPNGLDGVAKDKGERNSKPFQYLWVDPFFTTVRRSVLRHPLVCGMLLMRSSTCRWSLRLLERVSTECT